MAKPSQSDPRSLAAATGRTALKLSPCLLILLFVGTYRSPLFGTADYQVAAREMLAGLAFSGFVDYDQRSFEKDMAREIKTPISVLVAGSSRTMQLESDCFEGPYYNASVTLAMIPDMVAIVEEFRRGRQLKRVVIGADPWILNRAARLDPADIVRIPSASNWIRAQLRLGIMPPGRDWLAAARSVIEPYREILEPSSFQTAGRIFLRGRRPPTDDPRKLFRKEPDGSLHYADYFTGVDDARALALAIEVADTQLSTLYSDFWRIDPELSRILEGTLADLKANGTQVTLVLAPFHPAYYERVIHNGGGRMVPVVESYFRALAKREGYGVIGAYEAGSIGVTAPDFFDGGHMKKAALKRMFGCPKPPQE